MDPTPLALEGVPAPVRSLVDRLRERGFAAYLVGGCVRNLIAGRPARDFDVATEAAAEAVLQIFPSAIPIGLRHGTVMVPTGCGPVDVTSFRAGPRLADDLAHRDFTINAMAYDPQRGELFDPFDGRVDLAKTVLRAVGSARERLAEDPLRALRAARLAATFGFEVDAELAHALSEARRGLAGVARERVRHELSELLLGERAEAGLSLLRRAGIEADLAPGARDDAAAVVAALPGELEVRLAGWLRGTDAGTLLRRLRFPRPVVRRVDRMVRLHPIDGQIRSLRDADVRRLLRRVGVENLGALLALRRAELSLPPARDAAARDRLGALEEAVGRARRGGVLALRRLDLAIDGREAMRVLGCRPGPRVGRALRHLADRVVEDPSLNTPGTLRDLLEAWRDENPQP